MMPHAPRETRRKLCRLMVSTHLLPNCEPSPKTERLLTSCRVIRNRTRRSTRGQWCVRPHGANRPRTIGACVSAGGALQCAARRCRLASCPRQSRSYHWHKLLALAGVISCLTIAYSFILELGLSVDCCWRSLLLAMQLHEYKETSTLPVNITI